MTQSTVVFTSLESGLQAGTYLGEKIHKDLDGNCPSVVILFASSTYDYLSVIEGIKKSCTPGIIVGCSSAGEFTSSDFGTDSACAVAIYSDEMQFSAGIGIGISKDRNHVAQELFKSFKGANNYSYKHHTALVLADALSGHTDELIDILTDLTAGAYHFFGGGAGDNAQFQKTFVFYDDKVVTDAAVILEILSEKPIGIGVRHGWKPAGDKMRVTASEGMKVISINAMPAEEVFTEYAKKTKQNFDPSNPIPFFLHNVIGIETDNKYKLRVPLTLLEDGSIICASDVPVGSTISFMNIGADSARAAAKEATIDAIKKLNGAKPSVALFFDCVATRLRMGKDFGFELEEVKKTLNLTTYAGCNTYGQVARVDGQFSGFHNCTAVICVIPE